MTLPQTAQPPHARSLPPARFLPNGVDARAGGKSRVCRDACALEPIRDVPHVRRQPDHARGAELAVGVARPGWGLSSPTAALFVTTGRGTLLSVPSAAPTTTRCWMTGPMRGRRYLHRGVEQPGGGAGSRQRTTAVTIAGLFEEGGHPLRALGTVRFCTLGTLIMPHKSFAFY